MWEYMEKEAPQKLLCSHRHELLLTAMRVILPAEGDLTIGESRRADGWKWRHDVYSGPGNEERAADRRREASRTPPSPGGTANEGKNGMHVLAQGIQGCPERLTLAFERLSSARR